MKGDIVFMCLCCMVSFGQAAPLVRRMVDMTHTFDETTLNYPTMKKFQMNVLRNGTEDDGVWIQIEEYTSGIHVGTHMDAPAHFTKGGLTVDQIPLSRLVAAPAAVVDTTARTATDPADQTTVADLLRWEADTGHSLNGTILLMRSGWGKKWGDAEQFFGAADTSDMSRLRWPSIAPEAAQWLVDNRAIYGLGVETVSFDKAFGTTYPSHQILLGHGLFAIENVANMDQLPIYGAELHVLPMKIGKASGAPVRMVATFPEVMFDWSSTETRKYSSSDCQAI